MIEHNGLVAGNILLYKKYGIFDKITKRVTKGKYSHCEILIEDHWSIDICTKGIIPKFINPKNKGKIFDVWKPKYPDENCRRYAIAHGFDLMSIKGKYSIPHFIAFLFIKFFRRFKIRWFEGDRFLVCCEGIADCLIDGRVPRLKDFLGSLTPPGDLPLVFEMEQI